MTPEVRAQLVDLMARAMDDWDRDPAEQCLLDCERALDALLSATDEHGERLVVGRDELEQVGRDADMGRLHGAPAVRVDGKWKPVFMEVGP